MFECGPRSDQPFCPTLLGARKLGHSKIKAEACHLVSVQTCTYIFVLHVLSPPALKAQYVKSLPYFDTSKPDSPSPDITRFIT